MLKVLSDHGHLLHLSVELEVSTRSQMCSNSYEEFLVNVMYLVGPLELTWFSSRSPYPSPPCVCIHRSFSEIELDLVVVFVGYLNEPPVLCYL
jgi:hypothetical protein